MEKILVNGGRPLYGCVEVSGSKNAALPIIYACVLVKDKCIIENVPNVSDIRHSFDILRGIGAKIRTLTRTSVEIDCTGVKCGASDYNLVRKMRGSYYLLGAEFGRFGRARVAYPGGCDFGVRPIDQHIKGFEALGGRVVTDGGYIEINSDSGRAKGANIYFDVSTVGGTLNIMKGRGEAPRLHLRRYPRYDRGGLLYGRRRRHRRIGPDQQRDPEAP